jgi:hypothetical protein
VIGEGLRGSCGKHARLRHDHNEDDENETPRGDGAAEGDARSREWWDSDRATEVRRYRTLRHTFLLTDFVHGEIPCLIAFLLCSSDA